MMLLLLAHAGATLMMTGLIWFVQIVHYPLFERVPALGWVEYERHHVRRTTVVVMPLMLAEAVTAIWLLVRQPAGVGPALPVVGVTLLLIIWASTATLQVPCHRRLQSGMELGVVRNLVRTNWLRTAAWTARGALALALITMGGQA